MIKSSACIVWKILLRPVVKADSGPHHSMLATLHGVTPLLQECVISQSVVLSVLACRPRPDGLTPVVVLQVEVQVEVEVQVQVVVP